VGCPACPGSVELVPVTGRRSANIACVEEIGRPFEMRESDDLDGALRLALLGGLDILVVDRFTARLKPLLAAGRLVRLDLSELGFIDCTGFRAITQALGRARRTGWQLEIDRPISAPVKRVVTFLDMAAILWPPDADGRRPNLRLVGSTAGRRSEAIATKGAFGPGDG
jgi:anti-anti-sigma factor